MSGDTTIVNVTNCNFDFSAEAYIVLKLLNLPCNKNVQSKIVTKVNRLTNHQQRKTYDRKN